MKMLFLLLAVCFIAFSAYAEDVVREENITAVLNAGDCVEISNINGDISVEGWASESVEVVYIITCESQEEMEAIEVLCDTSNGIVCEVNYDEDWNRNHSGEVSFQIRVPSDQLLEYRLNDVNGDVKISSASGSAVLEAVNGDISAGEFNGELTVDLVNGSVTTSGVTGLKQVDIVNGSIDCSVQNMGCDLSISSVNGDIKVELMADASVEIETLSGDIDITNGYNAQIAESIVGSSASFGNGEFSMDISSVSGSIEITD